MKSEKVKEFIDGHVRIRSLSFTAADIQYCAMLAEQEAEERMRRKAAEAYKERCFHRDCDWCSISYDLDENGDYDAPQKCDKYCKYCGELEKFIQKLNEE